MSTFQNYQDNSARTLPSQPKYMTREERLILALGLAGEVGETIDLLKKVEGHGHEANLQKLKEEMGDILWYMAALCSAYGVSLQEAADENVVKLKRRYPEGFTHEASRNRAVSDV